MRARFVVAGLVAWGIGGTAGADPGRVSDDPNRTLAGICARGRERLTAGDLAGARAVLEEAVRAVEARRNAAPEVAADCLEGLAEVVETDLDRPGHVEEAAALYQRALVLRPEPAIRARFARVGTLAPIAGPFVDAAAAIDHLQEEHCRGDGGCRVWATGAGTSWSDAAIREAQILVVSTSALGAQAFVLLVTEAGAWVMPPVVTALASRGMTGGVGGTAEHRAVLRGGGQQVVVRAAAFRDFAERWEAARPSVQRIVVCDVADGAPRCTQPFEEAAIGRADRQILDLEAPGRVAIRRVGAAAGVDDVRPFESLRCAPWLFTETRCPPP